MPFWPTSPTGSGAVAPKDTYPLKPGGDVQWAVMTGE